MAKAEYGAGVVLFKEEDMAGALEKFERAHELARDHRLLWNVALCEKNLRRYARMLATLRRLEEEGGDALTAQDRQDIADLVKATETLVSRLEITASEPGAEVFVDDVAVGTTPLPAPVPVDIGARRIRIAKPGFKDFARTETIGGGGKVAIAARLEKAVHRGRLSVTAGAADLIAIDGKAVGRGRWEGALPSGAHALRVTAPGREAHRSDVLIQDDELRRVQIALNPAPEQAGSGKWLWIGGGAALLAGAVIAGALLFEPGKPAEQGSLGTYTLSVNVGRGSAFAGPSVGGRR
jgi:tetratricopeptide (TPR) repeat protein